MMTTRTTPCPFTARLFGAFEIRVHGKHLEGLHSRKDLWLLALLILRHDGEVDREWLREQLWPDQPRNQALFLRQSLARVRQALGDQEWRIEARAQRSLHLNLEGAEVDLIEFDAAIRRADTASLNRAVTLYRGALLEGCLEEWVVPEQTAREAAFLNALERLATAAIEGGDPTNALPPLRRLIACDPDRDHAHWLLMQAHALRGELGALEKLYRDRLKALGPILDERFAAEMRERYQRLRAECRLPPLPIAPARANHPGYLPVPATDLIGREGDISSLADLVRGHRLVTLLGIGGVGKTRLAIAAGAALQAEFAEGVWFVELAAVANVALAAQTMVDRLGLQTRGGDAVATLVEACRRGRLLLILDNCEHLLGLPDFTQVITRLLRDCAELHLLTTSRRTLDLAEETAWQVAPLPLPDRRLFQDPALMQALDLTHGSAAVRLFVERAVGVRKDFQLTARNGQCVAEICIALDGIPLALEMAAARVRSMSVEAILAHLNRPFGLLTGSRDMEERHRTLRKTLDWSYALLDAREQHLLRRLAVFVGGWSAEAVTEIGTDGGREGNAGWEAIDLLDGLTARSLVVYEEEAGEGRYRLLETLRQYALERLIESGEHAAIRARHCDYYLRFAAEADTHLAGTERGVWLRRLDLDLNNLRAALQWCVEEAGDAERGLRLADALCNFWKTRGYLTEGREALAKLLSHGERPLAGNAQARALYLLGGLAVKQADTRAADAHFGESLALYRQSGDAAEMAGVLHGLGIVAYRERAFERAHACFAEALALYTESQDRVGCFNVVLSLGNVAYVQDEYDSARARYEECMRIARLAGNRGNLANALSNLAMLNSRQGLFPAATRAYYEESLAIYRELEDKASIANTLNGLGSLDFDQGEHERARAYIEECLALRRELGDRRGIGGSLNDLGEIAFVLQDYQRARQFYEQSLEVKRALPDQSGIATSLHNLGKVARSLDDFAAASSCYRQSLEIYQAINDRRGIAIALESLAYLEAASCPDRAARLLGNVEELRAAIRASRKPLQQVEHDRAMTILRAALAPQDLTAGWDAGRAMRMDEAILDALNSHSGDAAPQCNNPADA